MAEKLITILKEQKSLEHQELAKLLSEIRTKSMGLPENIKKDLETAQLLQDRTTRGQ